MDSYNVLKNIASLRGSKMSKGATNTALERNYGYINKYQGTQDTLNTQLQGFLDQGDLPNVSSNYRDIAATGGYDPNQAANVTRSYEDIGTTGGYDISPVIQGYAEFAKTGGISPEQISGIKNEASQAARSTYQTAQSEAQRQKSVTGGFGYNAGIEDSLARKGSEAAARAASTAGATLAPLEQQGKLAGLGGQVNANNSIVANRLSGLAGEGNFLQNKAGNKLAALSGSSGIDANLLNFILQNYSNTAGLTSSLAGTQAGLAKQPGFGTNLLTGLQSIGGVGAGILGAIAPGGLIAPPK